MLDEKEIIETLENLAVDKYIDERKLEEKDVEAIINIIILYRQEKEKNKELESDIQQKNFEIKCLNSDIKNMYCEEDDCYADMFDDKSCKECIKQYFYRKVEKNGERITS